MTQRVQIPGNTLAAASRRRAAARYAAEHVVLLSHSPLLCDGDGDELLRRAYRLRRKRTASHVSAARTGALLR